MIPFRQAGIMQVTAQNGMGQIPAVPSRRRWTLCRTESLDFSEKALCTKASRAGIQAVSFLRGLLGVPAGVFVQWKSPAWGIFCFLEGGGSGE